MFNNIKTSQASKEIITTLTNKLGLGTENIISRIAFAYSLSQEEQLNIKDIKDSKGKEYSAKVLFGDYLDYYIALISLHYNIYNTDKDVARYVKMHIDSGLSLLYEEFKNDLTTSGFDFLTKALIQ